MLQLALKELGGTVVYDSKIDSDPAAIDGPVIDSYKEGYKEAMRDIWRWTDGTGNNSLFEENPRSLILVELKEFIQSQIKSAE